MTSRVFLVQIRSFYCGNQESAPFSITNAGFENSYAADPACCTLSRRTWLGILNCHHCRDGTTHIHHLALPSHRMTRQNAIRRHSSSLRYVLRSDVTKLEYQDFFEQLKGFQASELPLLDTMTQLSLVSNQSLQAVISFKLLTVTGRLWGQVLPIHPPGKWCNILSRSFHPV